MGGRGASSGRTGGRVAPLQDAKYDSFENRSTGQRFEMDGYVKARSYSEAFQALEKQAEHITGQKKIITNSVLSGESFGSWQRAVRNHPDSGSDAFTTIDNHVSGGEIKGYWRDNTDGRFHRMHIERIDDNYFYIDFGRSKNY